MKLRYKIANSILILLVLSVSALAVVLSHDAACGTAPEVSAGSDTMKAMMRRCYGAAEVLTLEDVEKPTPKDDEVLVKVVAASVNPLDWHMMRGTPYVLRLMAGLGAPDVARTGVDFAGTVAAVGNNVTRFKPGDEVFGGRTGAFAEFLLIDEDGSLTLKPSNVSFEQGASVAIAGITALEALRDSGKLQPGQKVLINGASGGVGTFAVQIAKYFGAEVTGVCSTRNLEMVRSIGADHVFDYTRENYTESGEQYDLIIDMVGNHGLLANRKVLKPDGTFVIVGGGKGNWLGPLMGPIKALLLSPFVDQELVMILAGESSEDLAILGDLMQAGDVTPVIDSRYKFSELREAIKHSEDGHASGKIIVNFP